jgi:hypothetical protein
VTAGMEDVEGDGESRRHSERVWEAILMTAFVCYVKRIWRTVCTFIISENISEF